MWAHAVTSGRSSEESKGGLFGKLLTRLVNPDSRFRSERINFDLNWQPENTGFILKLSGTPKWFYKAAAVLSKLAEFQPEGFRKSLFSYFVNYYHSAFRLIFSTANRLMKRHLDQFWLEAQNMCENGEHSKIKDSPEYERIQRRLQKSTVFLWLALIRSNSHIFIECITSRTNRVLNESAWPTAWKGRKRRKKPS